MDHVLNTGHVEKGPEYYDSVYRGGYYNAAMRYGVLYKYALDFVKMESEPSVLEIGCGTGVFGLVITDYGIKYRGFDFSVEAVECSRIICPLGHFQVADAYDRSSYEPLDYNVVVALEVFEHLDDLRVLSMLPTGITVIASVPNFNDIAHLRTYMSAEAIRKYYDHSLVITDMHRLVCSHSMRGAVEPSIFVFAGKTKQ